MKNMVVVHYSDGKLLKGFTSDFFPNRPSFHVQREKVGDAVEVAVADLKGVFFVKTFKGNAGREPKNYKERTGMGRRIKVVFQDGETLFGYTSGYSPNRDAFFAFPADPDDNNEKVFVVTAATKSVEFV